MARNKKHINDKFYTKDEVVDSILSVVDISNYNTIIEPSAGNGSFSNKINHTNLISLDIDPENDKVIKMNWFDYTYDKKPDEKILVIGNPPFGNQGSLALKFIKKCDEINANKIAFILPKSFKKDTFKNKIPKYYHLLSEIDISDNSFTLLNESYSVPSVFQIWERKDKERDLVEMKTKSDLISFVKKNELPDYSFRRVGFYAGKIYDEINDKSEQSHYFIRSNNDIRQFLENYNWEHNNTAGPRSIGKSEIIKIIESYEETKKN
jgi:hypothetical protein